MAALPTPPAQPLRSALQLLLPLGAVVALLLVVAGTAVGVARWVLLTDEGARWALARVPGLQASGWRGALLGPDWVADRLELQTADGKIKVVMQGVKAQGLQFVWRPNPQAWVGLQAQRLQVQTVTVDTGAPGPRPIPLPASIAMPLQLALQQLQVAVLKVDDFSPIQTLHAEGLVLSAAPGATHEVQAAAAQWQGLQLTASGHIGTTAPLPVTLQASARPWADGDAPRWAAVATLIGDLPLLQLQGTLRGPAQHAASADVKRPTAAPKSKAATAATAAAAVTAVTAARPALAAPVTTTTTVFDSSDTAAPAVDLAAKLQVLQAWPLVELALQTQALNLASLLPGAPQTRVSGSVKLASSAKDAPITAQLALGNTLPGRWNEGRLPIIQLAGEVSGHLTDRNQLDFQRMDVQLGDASGTAGRITGSGQWRGPQLQLQTRLQGLQPQRLDSRAAAMQLSGPLTATVIGLPSPKPADPAGPGAAGSAGSAGAAAAAAAAAAARAPLQVSWQTDLEGRLDAAPQPVRLVLLGSATAQRLEITRAQASTGSASAELRALLQRRPGAGQNPATASAAASKAGSAGAASSASAANSASAASAAADWQLETTGTLTDFDPLPWWPGETESAWRKGPHRLSANWRLDLRLPSQAAALAPLVLLQRMAGNGTITVQNSLLAGVPLAADITLAYQPTTSSTSGPATTPTGLPAPSLAPATLRAEIRAGGNTATLEGRGDPSGNGLSDRLRVELQADKLSALAPWARLHPELANWVPQQGTVSANFAAAGRWPALSTDGQARIAQLRVGGISLANGTAVWQLDMGGKQPLALQMDLNGLQVNSPTTATATADAGSASTSTTAPTAASAVATRDTPAAATATTLATAAKPKDSAWRADQVRAELRGTLAEHQLEMSASLPMGPPPLLQQVLDLPSRGGTRALVQAQGAWTSATAPGGGGTWRGTLQRLIVSASEGRASAAAPSALASALATSTTSTTSTTSPQPPAPPASPAPNWADARDLRATLQFDGEGRLQTLQAEPGSIALAGEAGLRWETVKLDLRPTPAHFSLRADLEPIAVAPLLARWQPQMGWRGDLKVGAHLEIDAGNRFEAEMVFERRSGDLQIDSDAGQFVMGLSDLRLGLNASAGQWQFTPFVRGKNLGEIAGSVRASTTPERRWPHDQAPIEGVVQARVADIGIWNAWVPVGWRLGGKLLTSATVSGRFGQPEYTGELSASQVAVRNLLQGVNVTDGELTVGLKGDNAQIERFTLRGGDGQINVTGGATLGANPQAKLELTADRFRVLGRVDRLVIVSGKASLALAPDQSRLDGKFTVDEGLFDTRASDAPSLDDDVNVRGPSSTTDPVATAATPRARRNFVMAVDIDLGPQLRVRGRGLDTALRGQLRLTAPGGVLAVEGSINTDGGTYAAYGQKLDIDRGILVFSGPANNPRLDVLALRPNTDTRVGVAIAGNLLTPRVRLYSDPDMSDTDKLSWLVLGRAPDGLGRADTALLQRAAVALLAGEGEAPTDAFMKSLGIDELSLRQADGDVRETVISLGKQLSRRWYVGYERGVNATTGTWQLIYRIAQRFTVRAQSGLENSLDVIWIWRTQETPASAAQNKTTVTPP